MAYRDATYSVFVLADGDSGKVKIEDRCLIRSRCMEGKNKRQDSRRSLREERRAHRLPRQKRDGTHKKPETKAVESTLPADTAHLAVVTRMDRRELLQALTPRLDRAMTQYTHSDTPTYPRELAFTSECFHPAVCLWPTKPRTHQPEPRSCFRACEKHTVSHL
jgi:hypothetical protein